MIRLALLLALTPVAAASDYVLYTDGGAFTYLPPSALSWPGGEVAYYINPGDAEPEEAERLVASAFAVWQDRADLTVTYRGRSSRETLPEGRAYPGAVLVEFISPLDMFERKSIWTQGSASIWWSGSIVGGEIIVKTETDLDVLVHEVGHVLGLGHSQYQESVMWPTLHWGDYGETLRADDIAAITSLYPKRRQADWRPMLLSADEQEACIYVPSMRVDGQDYQFEMCASTMGITGIYPHGGETP